MDMLMKMLGRRRENNFKKGVSLFFSIFYSIFFIKLILYTNSSLLLLFIETIFIIPSIKEDQEGIQESLCLSIYLSVCPSIRIWSITFFSSHELKARVRFSDHFLSVLCLHMFVRLSFLSISKLFTFRLFLKNHQANFIQTWHKASLGGGY